MAKGSFLNRKETIKDGVSELQEDKTKLKKICVDFAFHLEFLYYV